MLVMLRIVAPIIPIIVASHWSTSTQTNSPVIDSEERPFQSTNFLTKPCFPDWRTHNRSLHLLTVVPEPLLIGYSSHLNSPKGTEIKSYQPPKWCAFRLSSWPANCGRHPGYPGYRLVAACSPPTEGRAWGRVWIIFGNRTCVSWLIPPWKLGLLGFGCHPIYGYVNNIHIICFWLWVKGPCTAGCSPLRTLH